MSYEKLVDVAHHTLLNDSHALGYLLDTRGLTIEIIKEHKIGYILPNHYKEYNLFVEKKIARYTIPIYIEDTLCEIKAFSSKTKDHKDKWANLLNSGRPYVYPHKVLRSNTAVVLCEGELDCLLLNSKNIPAVTLTAGASMSFKQSSAKGVKGEFIDKEITICYDVDEAGSEGSEVVANILLPVADDIKIAMLNFARKERFRGLNDITDYFMVKEATVEEFQKVIEKAKRPGNRKKKLEDYDKAIIMAKDHPIATRQLIAEEIAETFLRNYNDVAADLNLPVSKLRQVSDIIQTYNDYVQDPVGRVPTGFPILDRNVFRGGPAKGCVVGIVGPSNSGKTIVCENILAAAAMNIIPIKSIFFSMEQEIAQAFERIAAIILGISPFDIEQMFKTGLVKESLIKEFTDKVKDNLLICSDGSLGLQEIDELIGESHSLFGETGRLIVVDYLGLINTKSEGMSQASEAAHGLKIIAKKHQCVIVTPLQVNNDTVRVKRSKDTGESLFQFRLLEWGDIMYSTMIYPHFDYVIGLNRPENAPGYYTLSETKQDEFRDLVFFNSLKNRDGACGHIIENRFDKTNLRIIEKRMRDAINVSA